MSVDKIQEAINVGKRAESLLRDEWFIKLLEALRSDLITEWEKSNGSRVDDVMVREDLRRQVILIARIKSKIELLASNGRIAQQKLN